MTYFDELAVGSSFYRGESLFRKTSPSTAVCLKSAYDFDVEGEEYPFGLSVSVVPVGNR